MIKKRTLRAIIGLLLLSSFGAFAQLFSTGERVTLESEVLGESRQIQVLLPEGYRAELSSNYPVIYLLDGDYNFHGMSGMLDLLANKGQLIPKVILVGLADKGTEQYRKYMTPNDSSSPLKENKGAATEFLAFLNQEVQPYIQQHYRTAEQSILVGHSIGGLFVLNSLLNAPNSFDNYVAISPSVWVSDNAIVEQAKSKIKGLKTQDNGIGLYLSLGDEMQMGQYAFINELDIAAPKNIDWHFKHYPDENHNSVGLIALRDSLKLIFKDWYLAEKYLEKMQPTKTLDYYAEAMKSLDIQQSIPAGVVHIMLRQHYRQNKADQVAGFIDGAIKRFPASKLVLVTKFASFIGYYDSQDAALSYLKGYENDFAESVDYFKALAGTYEQLKQDKQAKRYYQKALALAEQQNANLWLLNILRAKVNGIST